MRSLAHYSRRQLTLVRTLLGLFLVYQFLAYLPYAQETFGIGSWFAPEDSLLGAWSKYFFLSPTLTTVFLLALAGLGAALAAGLYVTYVAPLLWLGLVALVARNNFYQDFDLQYMGWLLLAFALIPKINGAYRMPRSLYYGAWIVLGVSYTGSGIDKCFDPHWRHGEVIQMVLSAKQGRDAAHEWVNLLPAPLWKTLTWLTLFIETSFLPLVLHPKTRPWIWLAMTCVQLGIASTLHLSELNIACLIFHAFVFDSRWLTRNIPICAPTPQTPEPSTVSKPFQS